jgi:hypothetical protein
VQENINKSAPSDEEKKKLENEIGKAARHHTTPKMVTGPLANLADIADARDAERRSIESKNAGWLEKTSTPCSPSPSCSLPSPCSSSSSALA